MPPEESPEAKYDRLKRQLQQSILSQYPNPERKGCPGNEALRALAAQPSDEDIQDNTNWHHVTHCSECYREVLEIRGRIKNHARRRIQLVRSAVAAAVLAIAVGMFLISRSHNVPSPARPQNAEIAYNKMTMDIPAMTRSEDGRSSSPIIFERKPEELTVNLPVGSKAGSYEFRILKNDLPVVSTRADAALQNGTTAFTVKINLSRVTPGNYSMSVRQVPWDWTYFPVVVR